MEPDSRRSSPRYSDRVAEVIAVRLTANQPETSRELGWRHGRDRSREPVDVLLPTRFQCRNPGLLRSHHRIGVVENGGSGLEPIAHGVSGQFREVQVAIAQINCEACREVRAGSVVWDLRAVGGHELLQTRQVRTAAVS